MVPLASDVPEVIPAELWFRCRVFTYRLEVPETGPVMMSKSVKTIAHFVYKALRTLMRQEGFRLVIVIETEPVEVGVAVPMSQGSLL